MSKHGLPPLVSGISDGKVAWKSIESVDYDTLGCLLSCHLIVEHYLDQFLATILEAKLAWGAARLSFTQKIALISGMTFDEPYNLPPVIKHLNSLRNRFGHNINAQLTAADLEPFRRFIESCRREGEPAKDIPTDPKDVLHVFTRVVCAYVAGYLSGRVHHAATQTRGGSAL